MTNNNPFSTLFNDNAQKLMVSTKKSNAKSRRNEKRVLITGMPGIGSVGRLTAEYLVETLKPKEIAEIRTKRMPTASFVQDNNLIVLPKIHIYQKKNKDYRIFVLTGDFQPLSEEDTFYFCEEVINTAKKLGITSIITTGGIGLPSLSHDPKVYVTGPEDKSLKKLSKAGALTQIFGIVGPIMGVS